MSWIERSQEEIRREQEALRREQVDRERTEIERRNQLQAQRDVFIQETERKLRDFFRASRVSEMLSDLRRNLLSDFHLSEETERIGTVADNPPSYKGLTLVRIFQQEKRVSEKGGYAEPGDDFRSGG